MTEKKKKSPKVLLDLIVPIKSTTTMGRWGEGKKEKRKKSKRNGRTSQNIIIIFVFFESLLSEFFSSLGVTVQLTSLGSPPTLCGFLDLLWRQLRF